MKNVEGHRNLKVREGKYYWRETIKGRKYFESLHVPYTGRKAEEKEAVARMQEKQKLARTEQFDRLDDTRVKVGYATIGAIIKQYEAAAAAYGLADSSRKKAVNSLKFIITTATGHYSDDLSSTVLTGKLVRDYRDAVLAGRTDLDTARRTIASTLRNARAVFAGWTHDEYRKLKLPDLTDFKKGAANRTHIKQYVLPPQDLIDRTIKAGRQLLQDGKTGLAAMFLLTYDCALRSTEAQLATRDWIGDGWIEVRAGKTWNARRVGRKIPLNKETQAELESLLRQNEEYILPGKHMTERKTLAEREFSEWMRGLGWTREQYPKTAHELRKLKGSRWYTDQGPHIAQTLLGHVSVATTCKLYATLDKLPEALPRES